MNYYTFNPAKELENFVKCHWSLDASIAEADKQRIVPDGCLELIFHYGDPFKQYRADGTVVFQDKAFVFGQITERLTIEPMGKTGIFATRFHPNGFIPFAKIALELMENRAVPLGELFGEEGDELAAKVIGASSNNERLVIVEAFLLDKLETTTAHSRLAKGSVDLMLELKKQANVKDLSDKLIMQRRSLERQCTEAIGLSPKQFSKIIRLRVALKMIRDKSFSNMTLIAHEAGYYDQAHFIKDFKEFTGQSPKHFYADNLKMTSLFLMEE